jgi:hypothetical protein
MLSYMRPGICSGLTSSQYAHVQLWNPSNPGSAPLQKPTPQKVIVKGIWVSGSPTGFTIVGHKETTFGMFGDASFPESRGLLVDGSLTDDDVGFYSWAHVRIMKGSAVDGGQYFNARTPNVPNFLNLPIVLRPGRGLVVRAYNNGEGLNVTYLWEEEPIA